MPSALSNFNKKLNALKAQSSTLGILDHFRHFKLLLFESGTLFELEILFPICATFEKLDNLNQITACLLNHLQRAMRSKKFDK